MRRNHDVHGSKDAVVTLDRRITHAELDVQSAAFADGLLGASIGKSSRVALLAENGIEWAVVAAGVMRAGAVLVPLSTLLRPPELEAQLRVADVTHLIATRSFRGRSHLDEARAVAASVPSVRAVWALDEVPFGHAVLELPVRPADDLVILFTSGSRGTPKGTVHTHGSALRAVASSLDARQLRADDRLYIPMPFFWTGGLCMGLLSALVAGATLLTEAQPEPGATLELLERERVTLFRGWPDQGAQLAADPRFALADLRGLRPASLPAVLPAEQRPLPGARPNLFGMTETFGPWCGGRLDVDLPVEKWGSCGRPFGGIEVRVVDPGSGVEVPPGQIGELRVRGANLLRAICGRTREETFDEDGFYPTGDVGSVDGDGYVWSRGRVDDMLKVKGATVYPTEVEAALRALAGVRQAHVTDVAGEVAALVITDRSLDDVVTSLRQQLSAFKVPMRWYVTPDAGIVPRTATDKVDKAALQALFDA